MSRYVLALDQGTTSSRALIFAHDGQVIASAQREFPQLLPSPGHVEHDPEEIWQSQLQVARQALERASLTAADLAAIGIANQRETTLLWERDSGRPVGNAIVWQSRISSGVCRRLRDAGCEPAIRRKTGLVLDAYFSASKITWLLEQYPGLRARASRGEILFGTVDTFLLWRLTGGVVHATDYSNASRTLLLNIHTLDWDDELLALFDVPRAMLPRLVASSELLGHTLPEWFGGSVPVAGVAGDQQAATFGQACFEPGMAKNTYGTGCFLLLNTGQRPVDSQNRLLATIGWVLDGRVTYCLEGSVFIAGAVVQWLRDGLGLIRESAEVEQLAATVPDAGGVYLVPAFVGLGAPYWDPAARGVLAGLTRGTRAGHLARAAVESMAYQTCDLVHAMREDAGVDLQELRADGGAAVNDQLLQFQADLLNVAVQRPKVFESTALGAAYLAGLAVGFWQDLDELQSHWQLDRQFRPAIDEMQRRRLYGGWQRAVERSRGWAEFEIS
ncbi:MAG: glycerol kinase GlpK [Pirellulaceae bacterium]|nr:glycerol kinase GlpK [Pirellulaceae bacterium]